MASFDELLYPLALASEPVVNSVAGQQALGLARVVGERDTGLALG
ncbi:MAG TPA: hypothetical protein VMI33_17370 [Streptosporangiaceae bacterium]|nr:hypothetical protein [Streptosporangiaceae bacterium]